ncbi:MAG: phage portal protein [Candidatus Binatia bacterium]
MFKALANLFKLREMTHPGRGPLIVVPLPRTKFDYQKSVGDGSTSSVIMGPVQWMQRAFSEAPLIIERKTGDSTEFIPDHPLAKLIRNPNPFYSETVLWMATIFSWCTAGNVYWLKIRNRAKQVIQLWWAPHWLIKPVWPQGQATTTYISGYEYRPGGSQPVSIPIEDVVHIRHGIDPNNLRLGISPLASVVREVWMDNEASNWVGSLLRNSGIPGVIVSPDSEAQPLQGDVDAVKQYFREMFMGDRRGEPLVLTGKTKVEQFGFDPKTMDLSAVRNVSEERVCSALGIPAAVVGFGTGLEATKVGATMTEMRKLAWVNGIIPIQKIIATEVARSLLTEFEKNRDGFLVSFDLSGIAALQESMDKLVQRTDIAVKGGWLKVKTAQELAGLPVDDTQDLYLRSIAIVEIRSGESRPEEEETAPPPKSNGHDPDSPLVKQDIPSSAEMLAIGSAPRRRVPRALRRAAIELDKFHDRLSKKFAEELDKTFQQIGEMVARVAGDVLAEKQVDVDVERILDAFEQGDLRSLVKQKYDAQYLLVSSQTFDSMNSVLGLSTQLPDSAAQRVLAAGGRRLGLVDLDKQTRDKIFATLTEAQEQAEPLSTIVQRLRDEIPRGPWSSSEIRAKVIARTETKFAQNVSMMEYTKAVGARRAMVFDARLGDTDEICETINGTIVDLPVAEQLVEDEHPNGSRSFTPWFQELEVAE